MLKNESNPLTIYYDSYDSNRIGVVISNESAIIVDNANDVHFESVMH